MLDMFKAFNTLDRAILLIDVQTILNTDDSPYQNHV